MLSVEYLTFEHIYSGLLWDLGQDDLAADALKVPERMDRIIV